MTKQIQEQLSTYRPDIDGLRAIAVIAVVLFHAFPSFLPGGFIGVDIFFVISGYLISGIIFQHLGTNTFSVAGFYGKRIRRIFPALFLVLCATLLLGWHILLADEYAQLGKHVVGGAGFIANFLYWSESGYFDTAAEAKPLLHLWSLGVEEQFYILWPVLLVFLWKRQHNVRSTIIVLIVLSFSFNIGGIGGDGAAIFYSPLSRFWELLLGALLAYGMAPAAVSAGETGLLKKIPGAGICKFLPFKELNGASAEIRAIAGLLLIVAGAVLTDQNKIFPGWWALFPTLGAALLISAGSQTLVNKFILSNRILVWFGLISYPLYLWHWPLLTFVRIVQGQAPSFEIRATVVLLAILLAAATYSLVEKPIRFTFREKKGIPVALLMFMGILGLVGYSFNYTEGVAARKVVMENPDIYSQWDGKDRGMLKRGCGLASTEEMRLFNVCSQDSRQNPRFALLGDSKASAIFAGLVRTSSENGRWLCIGGHSPHGSPLPVLSTEKIYQKYQKLTNVAISAIIENDDIEAVALVMATRSLFNLKTDLSIESLPASPHYEIAREGLLAAVKKILAAGKKVVLVVDNPTLAPPKDCIERRTSLEILNTCLGTKENPNCSIEITKHLELSSQYRRLLQEIAAFDPDNISIFDTIEYLCDTDLGVCKSSGNGRLLYSYTDHISDYAAGIIGKNLNSHLMKMNMIGAGVSNKYVQYAVE